MKSWTKQIQLLAVTVAEQMKAKLHLADLS